MAVDLTDQKFSRLVVLGPSPKTYTKMWLCLCDCGNEKIIAQSSLIRKLTKSCGCLQSEVSRESIKSLHAPKHGLSRSRISKRWSVMVQRCTNPNNSRYKDYGGRGITVCERWLKFENFYKDMGEPPENTSLDRIDNDKGYSPENCRWADKNTQAHNKRRSKRSLLREYIGVVHRTQGCWQASCRGEYLGSFPTKESAARAYDKRAKEVFGEYAKPNFEDS